MISFGSLVHALFCRHYIHVEVNNGSDPMKEFHRSFVEAEPGYTFAIVIIHIYSTGEFCVVLIAYSREGTQMRLDKHHEGIHVMLKSLMPANSR